MQGFDPGKWASTRLKVSIAAAAVIGFAASSAAAAAIIDSPADAVVGEARLAKAVSSPHVTAVGGDMFEVDFGSDPEAAFAAVEELEAAAEDDITIVVKGMATKTPAQRRAEGAKLSVGDRPIKSNPCPDRPRGNRSVDGSTTAYFGCSLGVGGERRGEPVKGTFTASLTSALSQVVQERLPAKSVPSPRVYATAGNVVVDLPPSFADATRELPSADQYELHRDLWFTAYSNGLVDSVQFSVGGDCLAYALAVGGDTCSTSTFTE